MKTFFIIISVCIGMSFYISSIQDENYKKHELYKELSTVNFGNTDESKTLYIIVGIDYIPYDLIELFQGLTGIKVVVDIFDSNEILEAKMLAGGVHYDIVFPTAWPNFSRQLAAGIYRPIDKSKLNFAIFDKYLLSRLAEYDINNSYAIPYQWGISGVGINKKIIDKLLNFKTNASLGMVFDKENAKRLSQYRISLYESPDELFPALLAYLGLDPCSEKEEDTLKAAEHLKSIRKYITKFTSYGFEDLASGNACITLGTSGDIVQVSLYNKNPDIKFVFPKEGASLWVDVAALPKNAKHINNIYAFFNFLFHPKVIAYVTNNTSRANAVIASNKFVNRALIDDKNVYPDDQCLKKCYIEKPISANISELRTRLLTKIKSMEDHEQ